MTASGTGGRAERLRRAVLLKKARAGRRPPELPRRPPQEAAHLGEMQRGLWLAHQLDPASPAYNLTQAFRIHGPLDLPRLRRAFEAAVARHRLLRSTFKLHRGSVRQIIRPPDEAPEGALSFDRLEEREGAAVEAAVREARKPFDLETGPLIRLRLIEEVSSGERLLLLVLHHILADERSLALLWQEVARDYGGEPSGRPSPAPAPAVQFDDHVFWQRQQGGGKGQEDLEFWRERLDPLPESLRLPFERGVFEGPSGELGPAPGRLLRRPLDPAVQEGIRRLAADTGATPFQVFAFAFRYLLHRYTGGRPVAFATPVSTRSHPATAEMIGYFLNPLVVSIAIDEGRSVAGAVRHFGAGLKESLRHASIPFQTLAEELSPPRQRDRHPIFQYMFVYQEEEPPPRLESADLEPRTLDLGASKFDLTLFVREGQDRLEIAVEYRQDRFDRAWMEALLGHYEALLEHLPGDLRQPLARVPLVGKREESRLRRFSRGQAFEAGEALLPQRILQGARRSPEAPAVVCGGVRRTYGDLEAAARSIAGALRAQGVRRGDRVGIFLERSFEMIAGILGAHRAGAAYVPLDPGYPPARHRDVLEDAEVAAVLTTGALAPRLPRGGWRRIEVDGPEGPAEADLEAPPPADLSPALAAYLLYTSGSTGRPKGVVVTHGNLRASTAARRQVYDAPPGPFLLVPSVAFDSSVAGIFWTLATAGTLVIPTEEEARDPRRLVRLVAEEGVKSLLAVPSLYGQMLRAGGGALAGLETAIVAGESCPPALVEEHFGALPRTGLFNEYGPTEGSVWATVQELAAGDGEGPVAIGRPIPGVRLQVLDALGRRVPAGIPGQAWIVGPTVAQGYWRRPGLTAERFDGEAETGERRYRTGDRVAWTAEGRLLFLGRQDAQIKLRGVRIEPGEIEAALLEDPAIDEAAVVARPLDPAASAGSGEDRLVAFLRTGAGGPVTDRRRALAGRLPELMIPSHFVELPELPRLPNGKVHRRALQDLPLGGEALSRQGAREGGAVLSTREEGLLSLWEGLLGRSGISPADNFFELGGHSLLVVEMAMAIERDFEVSLSSAEVFANPTVAQLARRIGERGASAEPPYRHLFPLQPRGRKAPFIIAVPHFFSQLFASRFRGERPVYGLRGVSLRPEGNRGLWATMEELGEELADEIERRFPGEGCILAGYSFGASMAFEAARILEERGRAAERLYLIAPMPLDFVSFGPFRVQLDGLRRPVDQLSTGQAVGLFALGNHPLSRRLWARLRRRLVVQPWRRLLCAVGAVGQLAGRPLTPRILHADVRLERFRLHARHRPGRIHTPTVFFNPRQTPTDAAATWRPHFLGPFTVHGTPDPHSGEASAEAAKQVILRHLEDLEDA